MNRCTRSRARGAFAALLAGALLTLSPLLTHAQAPGQGFVREAPKDVKPGRMVISLPPVITMDGKPDRLSPGSRIRDFNNMLVLSGGIVNKDLPVVYRRDAAGMVHEVWLLTEQEYTKLGGTNAGSGPDGYRRFVELLNLIFSLRK